MLPTYSHRHGACMSLHGLQTCSFLFCHPPSPDLSPQAGFGMPLTTLQSHRNTKEAQHLHRKPQWINPRLWSAVLGLVSLSCWEIVIRGFPVGKGEEPFSSPPTSARLCVLTAGPPGLVSVPTGDRGEAGSILGQGYQVRHCACLQLQSL